MHLVVCDQHDPEQLRHEVYLLIRQIANKKASTHRPTDLSKPELKSPMERDDKGW